MDTENVGAEARALPLGIQMDAANEAGSQTEEAEMPGDVRLLTGICSKKGPRAKNDDRCGFSGDDAWGIADGIGGAEYGDAVAQVSVTAAIRAFKEGHGIDRAFEDAAESASLLVDLLGDGGVGAGCTLLLAERTGPDVISLAWVGDSAAYVCRGDGELSVAASPDRAMGNALATCLGRNVPEPLRAEVRLNPGDALLMCTDGVWEEFEGRAGDLVKTVLSAPNAPFAAIECVDAALLTGRDNASAMVVFAVEA